MFTVSLTTAAHRQYKKLPRDVHDAVADVFEGEFSHNPLSRALDVTKLHKPFEGYRLRVGVYRVLFMLEKEIITVYSIKHRKDAYR